MQWFNKTNIDFVGKRKAFFYFSIIITLAGILGTIILGPEYGIDFEGGTEIAVKFKSPVEPEAIRNAVNKTSLKNAEIKSFGSADQFLIRVGESSDAPDIITAAMQSNFDSFDKVVKVDKIGPKIGAELRNDAFWAVLLSVVFILLYIAFRFDFVFGLGAIVALVHDVLMTFTMIVLINHTGLIDLELNQTILAALLTVVGYSINDTVIIFDRIRENKELHKGNSLTKLINTSINETLSRTVNTVGTTLLVLLTIMIIGGPILQGFAFTMLLGIIFGTYSSVYIASSFVIWYNQKVNNVNVESGSKNTSPQVAN